MNNKLKGKKMSIKFFVHYLKYIDVHVEQHRFFVINCIPFWNVS